MDYKEDGFPVAPSGIRVIMLPPLGCHDLYKAIPI